MFSGLVAFAADGMFSFPNKRIEHSLYGVLMVGIILGNYLGLTFKKTLGAFSLSPKLLGVCVVISVINIVLAYKTYKFEKHAVLAKQYRLAGDYRLTVENVKAGKSSWVTLDPNGEPLEMQSAAALRELKDYEGALKEIKKARRYHPNSARILTTMGVIYADMKKYDQAAESYLDALKLAPGYVTAVSNLAGVYFLQEKFDKCLRLLDKVNLKDDDYLQRLKFEANRELNVRKQ